MEEAWRVFNSMPKHGVIAWNAMILGLVKCGQGQEALALSQQMQQEGVEPDPVTFIGILNACASLRALEEGKCIHEQIIKSSFDSNVNVTTRIINMYVKCGSMEDAFKVFHSMPAHDVVVWNVMILGYVKYGQGQKALALYEEMQHEGVKPNSVTFVGAINACASIIALEQARHIHKQIIDCGCESNLFVGSSLVDMYAKMGEDKGCLQCVQQDAHTWCCGLECHDFWKSEMWAWAEGISIISTNATRRGAARLHHFPRGSECMCRLLECHAGRLCHAWACSGSSWTF
jgi:pentatricopeptide repeat protein